MSEANPAPTAEPTLALYPEPGAPEPEKTPDTPEPSQDAVQTDTPDTAPETEKEPEAHEAAPDGAEPEQSGEEDEGEVVSTFAELMEAKELDPDWVDTLTVPVTVNGKDGEVTIKDLVSSYRMNEAAEERLEKAKAHTEAAKEEIAQQTDSLNTQLAVAAKLMSRAQDMLAADVSAVDWEDLRESDPAEFAAKKAEFAERSGAIESAKAEALAEITAETQQASQAQSENFEKQNLERFTKFVEETPALKDSGDKAKEEYLRIGEYMIAGGFHENEVLRGADHRHFIMARKAMLYDAISNNAPSKKVVKTLKVLKPGGKSETTQKPAETDRATLLYG